MNTTNVLLLLWNLLTALAFAPSSIRSGSKLQKLNGNCHQPSSLAAHFAFRRSYDADDGQIENDDDDEPPDISTTTDEFRRQLDSKTSTAAFGPCWCDYEKSHEGYFYATFTTGNMHAYLCNICPVKLNFTGGKSHEKPNLLVNLKSLWNFKNSLVIF